MELKNTAKKYLDDPVIADARGRVRGRGEYLYQLVAEARKAGLSPEFAHKAIYNWGDGIRKGLKDPNTTNLKEIIDQLFTETEMKVWEDQVTVTEDEVRVEFHYCPLLEGFRKYTDDPAELKELCDIAMECDVALFSHPDFEYAIEENFFTGCDYCAMVIRRKRQDAGE